MLHLKRDSISRTLQQMLLLQCLSIHVIGTTNNIPRKLNLIKSIMSSIKDAFKSILFPIHLKIPYQPIFILPLLQRYFTFNCPMKHAVYLKSYLQRQNLMTKNGGNKCCQKIRSPIIFFTVYRLKLEYLVHFEQLEFFALSFTKNFTVYYKRAYTKSFIIQISTEQCHLLRNQCTLSALNETMSKTWPCYQVWIFQQYLNQDNYLFVSLNVG